MNIAIFCISPNSPPTAWSCAPSVTEDGRGETVSVSEAYRCKPRGVHGQEYQHQISSYLVTQLYLVDSFATVALFLYEEEMLIVSGVDISCSGMRLRRTSWTAVTTWPGCWPAPSSSSPCRSPAAPSMTSYQCCVVLHRFHNHGKAPTRAFSWLKAPTSTFTFKDTMLNRH